MATTPAGATPTQAGRKYGTDLVPAVLALGQNRPKAPCELERQQPAAPARGGPCRRCGLVCSTTAYGNRPNSAAMVAPSATNPVRLISGG